MRLKHSHRSKEPIAIRAMGAVSAAFILVALLLVSSPSFGPLVQADESVGTDEFDGNDVREILIDSDSNDDNDSNDNNDMIDNDQRVLDGDDEGWYDGIGENEADDTHDTFEEQGDDANGWSESEERDTEQVLDDEMDEGEAASLNAVDASSSVEDEEMSDEEDAQDYIDSIDQEEEEEVEEESSDDSEYAYDDEEESYDYDDDEEDTINHDQDFPERKVEGNDVEKMIDALLESDSMLDPDVREKLSKGVFDPDVMEKLMESIEELERFEKDMESQDAEEDPTVDEDSTTDEDGEYNPMGVQNWTDEKSFLRALEGGRLVLLIMLAPWCRKGGDEMISSAALAAKWLDDLVLQTNESDNTDGERSGGSLSPLFSYDFDSIPLQSLEPLPKPLIGIMNSETISPRLKKSLGPVSAYPALKFVLTFPSTGAENEEQEENEGEVMMWDYIGPKQSPKDLYDSVLMYWYRFVVSNALDKYLPYCSNEAADVEGKLHFASTDDIRGEEDGEARPPIFNFSSHDQMVDFLRGHGERVFRPAQARRPYHSETLLESELFDFYMGDLYDEDISGVFHEFERFEEDGAQSKQCEMSNGDKEGDEINDGCTNGKELVQEIDPYILMVQCRLSNESKSHNKLKQDTKMEGSRDEAKINFDELAEEMAHRRDVAFFTLEEIRGSDDTEAGTDEKNHQLNIAGTICDSTPNWFRGMGEEDDGAVAVLRVRRYVTYSLVSPSESQKFARTSDGSHNIWHQQRRRVIHSVTSDWESITMEHGLSRSLFVPSSNTKSETKGSKQDKNKGTRATEHIQSSLVPFTVIHTTPTVMWFDKERMAQLAFPWYRTIHAVLFVDLALAHQTIPYTPSALTKQESNENYPQWPSTLNHSSETARVLLDQRKAIQMFYGAALEYRKERPSDDVVFLIVPSSEVRVLTAFGVDIWTPLDEAIMKKMNDMKNGNANSGSSNDIAGSEDPATDLDDGSGVGYCSANYLEKSSNILPVMMITDSSGRSRKQSSRYYMCSEDFFASSGIAPEKGGQVRAFVDHFFNETIGKPFVRDSGLYSTDGPTTQNGSSRNVTLSKENMMNENGVYILTGNTFEPMVTERNETHSMVLMQVPTCGHCKRFSIFWNEFSNLVKELNWGSVINVMKIDVSKNDVPHKMVDAWDLPSVYYFPAGEKDEPIEMTTKNGSEYSNQIDYDEGLSWVNSGYDLVEWMVNQGKLDLQLLLKLDSPSDFQSEHVEVNEEEFDESDETIDLD